MSEIAEGRCVSVPPVARLCGETRERCRRGPRFDGGTVSLPGIEDRRPKEPVGRGRAARC